MKRQRTTENVTLTIERVRAEKIRKEAARVGLGEPGLHRGALPAVGGPENDVGQALRSDPLRGGDRACHRNACAV